MPQRPEQPLSIRFALPSEALKPFVTTYYLFTYDPPEAGMEIEDYFHPEWANLRFISQPASLAQFGESKLKPSPGFHASGPTAHAAKFRTGKGHAWGIGLMPLGWAKFIDASAEKFADRFVDGCEHPAFAAFTPLAGKLIGGSGDFDEELAVIEDFMDGLMSRELKNADAILAVNAALVDPAIDAVSDLAEAAGMTVRTLERMTRGAFGFSPKLLLRRQRFLRSMAQFMLDPSMTWLGAIDSHYHDQAHFTREFRHFMGMTPTAYSRLEHPLLGAAAKARARVAGEAMQVLQSPDPPV